MGIRRTRGGSDNGMNITGDRIQVNTGHVGGDMHQENIGSDSSNAPEILAAQAKLSEMTTALQAYAGEVHNIDACRESVARIDEELRSPHPNQRRLTETLQYLSLAIGSVTSVLNVADGLKNAIQTLFT